MPAPLRRTTEGPELAGAEGGVVEEVRLSQDLTLLDITMLGIGALMGGGVFVLLGIGAGVAGPALLLAFFLNGLVTLPTLLVYAQLGSAFHDAGGGYLWIKGSLRQPWGFLGGWMGWFSHAVACAVYSLASGYFLTWVLKYAGWVGFDETAGVVTAFGRPMAEHAFVALVGVAFAAGFILLNYVGVKQSVRVENAINAVVLLVVAAFLAFGLRRLAGDADLARRNFADFAPHGMGGVLLAMGVTFIAFEGYEIIAQSSEEVKNPRRNVPRAIFTSMGVVWGVILLTTLVAIGVVPIEPSWRFLGEHGTLAIVEAAPHVFPASWGAYASLIVLASALLLQLVGLNATIYSSSRVSFAMGRDGNLPRFFGDIHEKHRTPHWSVLFSGAIIVLMAVALPIESVAVAADIMFLLLFLLVNVAYVKLHKTMPREAFGFVAPFFPLVPVAGILGNALLAAYLWRYSPVGWLAAVGWIGVGLVLYYAYVHPRERVVEEKERKREVVHEETKGPRKDFRILVPLANPANVKGLALAARDVAKGLDGEVVFLYIVRVPEATPLREGARFVDEARPLFRAAEQIANDVPTHFVVRIAHNVSEAIRATAEEKGASLLLIGWRGDRRFHEFVLGGTLDPLVESPPCDLAVLKLRDTPPPGRIIVPTHGGTHAPLSVRLAGAIARARQASITMFNVVPPEEEDEATMEARRARGRWLFQQAGAADAAHEIVIKNGRDPIDEVVKRAKGYDLMVIGATTEPAWRNYLFGRKPEQLMERFGGSVLMVKQHQGKRGETMRRLGRRLKQAARLLRPG